MSFDNLVQIVHLARSLRPSKEFEQGIFFILGAALLKQEAPDISDKIEQRLQWVYPHDQQKNFEMILGRTFDYKIRAVIEEMIFKTKINIPIRDIKLADRTLHLFTPQNHNLLPSINLEDGEMRQISTLYFSMIEEIGHCLNESAFWYNESYQAGIYLFRQWAQIDYTAISVLIDIIDTLAPPVVRYLIAVPKMQKENFASYLPTQMAFWGFAGGYDDDFMALAWPFQSWVLFKNQVQYPGIEDLHPKKFYSHTYRMATRFFNQYRLKLKAIENQEDFPPDIPEFTRTGTEDESIRKIIRARWGYDFFDETLTPLDCKQVNACIIFSIFCSMVRGAQSEKGLDGILPSSHFDIDISIGNDVVNSFDDFVSFSEKKLEAFPRFSMLFLLKSKKTKSDYFIVIREMYPPETVREMICEVIIALEVNETFILFFADLSKFFDDGPGGLQSVAFNANENSTAPYWFCSMLMENGDWRIQPFSRMKEHDKYGSIFLSDISKYFTFQSSEAVNRARQSLAQSLPHIIWPWLIGN